MLGAEKKRLLSQKSNKVLHPDKTKALKHDIGMTENDLATVQL